MTTSKQDRKIYGSTAISIALVLIMIVAVNVISANLFFRWDITQEKLYTLSDGTKKIVSGIKTPITLKYYFTKSSESLPLTFKAYGKKINEFLEEYQNINPEFIKLEVYDPKPDSDEEEWAKNYGIMGIDLQKGEKVFLGIVAIMEDKELNIGFLDPRREQFLEYDITQLLLRIDSKKKDVIGVMSSIPVMGSEPNQMQRMQGQQGMPKWVLLKELEKDFKIESFDPATTKEISEEVSTLMVIHPKKLSDHALYAIDQFVLRGGELVVLVDPNSRMDQTAAMAARMGGPADASSDLGKLFKHWGIHYDAKKILGDKAHAAQVNAGGAGIIPFSLWHVLDKRSFNTELVATKDLENMLMIEPGGFTVDEKSSLKLTNLIKSSTNSGLIDSYLLRISKPLELNKKVKSESVEYTLAGILNGKLTSAFEKKPDGVKSDQLKKSRKDAKILLIADTDFISDPYSVDQFNLLGQVIYQPKNDNLNFFINMIEFLGGAEEMMQIRSRGRFSRPFTRFMELEQYAQTKYQEAEMKLSEKLKDVQARLSQLNVQKGSNQIVLSKDQIEQIKQFREEEKKTQTELRKIRKLLRQDIESEKTILTLLNLFVVPVLLTIFGIFLYFRRFKRQNL